MSAIRSRNLQKLPATRMRKRSDELNGRRAQFSLPQRKVGIREVTQHDGRQLRRSRRGHAPLPLPSKGLCPLPPEVPQQSLRDPARLRPPKIESLLPNTMSLCFRESWEPGEYAKRYLLQSNAAASFPCRKPGY